MAIRRMDQREPIQSVDPLTQVVGAQGMSQLWGQLQLIAAGQQLPPTGAEQILQYRQALDVMAIVLLVQAKQYGSGKR